MSTDWQQRNLVLGDFEGQRVRVKGIFEKYAERDKGDAVLVQDLEVELKNEWTRIGHVWLQHAEFMQQLKEGDRFEASCRVSSYTKKSGEQIGMKFCNLSYPQQIKVFPPPPAVRLDANWKTEKEVKEVKKASSEELEKKAMNLIHKLGFVNYQKLKELVKEAGSWTELDRLVQDYIEEKNEEK